jgi:hypothetical protein
MCCRFVLCICSVETLLTAGADASQKCLTGETALLFAIEKGHGAAAEVNTLCTIRILYVFGEVRSNILLMYNQYRSHCICAMHHLVCYNSVGMYALSVQCVCACMLQCCMAAAIVSVSTRTVLYTWHLLHHYMIELLLTVLRMHATVQHCRHCY